MSHQARVRGRTLWPVGGLLFRLQGRQEERPWKISKTHEMASRLRKAGRTVELVLESKKMKWAIMKVRVVGPGLLACTQGTFRPGAGR